MAMEVSVGLGLPCASATPAAPRTVTIRAKRILRILTKMRHFIPFAIPLKAVMLTSLLLSAHDSLDIEPYGRSRKPVLTRALLGRSRRRSWMIARAR